MGPNFHAAQMATTQKTKDAASRTNPRSNPMMVETNRTKPNSMSAPVISRRFLLRRFAPDLLGASRHLSTGSRTTPPENIYKEEDILPAHCAGSRGTGVTNLKSSRRAHRAPGMSQGRQPRSRLGGGPAVRQRADAHAVPRGGSGPARQH